MVYLITYDLMRPGQDYSALITEIKNLGNWAKPCESAWLVDTILSAQQVVDRLKAIDMTDKLLVTTISAPWWSEGIDPRVIDWLKQRC